MSLRIAAVLLAAPFLHQPAMPPPATPLPVLRIAAPAGDTEADMDFLLKLALMEGHLMIGHELLLAGRQPLALPHFGHPVRELYDDIAPHMQRRGVAGFEADLLRLETAATAAPAAASTEARYQAVIAAVRRSRASVPEPLRASVPQMVRLCADVLDVAAGEYGEALERGRLRNIVEYHDSRGFVQWVREEVDRLRRLPASDPALFERFLPPMEGMWRVVAALAPEGAPRASVSTYRELANQAGAAAPR